MHIASRCLVSLLALIGASLAHSAEIATMADLGQALFFDVNLSHNRTQACASCHSPEHGFVDPRATIVGDNSVSLGQDGVSLGDRNAPTVAYAAFSPGFHRDAEGRYIGGQFLDGRAADLSEQAGGPPLNPLEMAMPDKAAVVARLRENPDYDAAFRRLYGDTIFADPDLAYAAMAASIAAFEQTELFAPFDSKYDRFVRGEYQMSAQEELGMTLFFSQQFSNCNLCHQLKPIPNAAGETFSNYQYHNIGVPQNEAVRATHGGRAPDRGLLANPRVEDPGQAGRFKVPTLRNVAVTGPYMHNGVFKDLRTVVLFYNKYNSRSLRRQINPETLRAWAEPEIAANLSRRELETGPALDDQRIDALVAFMRTLTDRRYEHLLKD